MRIDEEVLLSQASSILSSLAGDCDTIAELMKNIVKHEDEMDLIKDCSYSKGNTIIDELV